MGPAVVSLVDFLYLKALFELQILFVDCDRKMIINSLVVRIGTHLSYLILLYFCEDTEEQNGNIQNICHPFRD